MCSESIGECSESNREMFRESSEGVKKTLAKHSGIIRKVLQGLLQGAELQSIDKVFRRHSVSSGKVIRKRSESIQKSSAKHSQNIQT